MDLRARKFFERGGRVFRLGYERWRERLQMGIAYRFYVKPREDKRSVLGRRIDSMGLTLVLWLFTFILLSTGREIKTAFLISIPVLLIEVLAYRKFKSFLARQASRYAPQQPVRKNVAGGGPGADNFSEKTTAILAAVKLAAFGSRKKFKNYILMGFFMYIGHLFLRDAGFLGAVYLVFALLNFGLGAACLFAGKSEPGPLPGNPEPEEK